MSVVSPRDFSAISRPNGGTETRVLPATLPVLPNAHGHAQPETHDEGDATVARARRHIWAVYGAKDQPDVMRPVGGPSRRIQPKYDDGPGLR